MQWGSCHCSSLPRIRAPPSQLVIKPGVAEGEPWFQHFEVAVSPEHLGSFSEVKFVHLNLEMFLQGHGRLQEAGVEESARLLRRHLIDWALAAVAPESREGL